MLAPPGGVVGGVDVRGGGPGTRETDLLDPRNLVERVHAIVLSGGSAFGLAAADGVMRRLADGGVGFPVGGAGEVVPIVPGRGALRPRPRRRLRAADPTRALGDEALPRPPPAASRRRGACAQGIVGAGTGAVPGGLKGGIGSASVVLADGTTVAALAVVNAGRVGRRPAHRRAVRRPLGLAGEFARLAAPSGEDVRARATGR